MDKINEHQKEFELYYSLLVEWNQKFNLTAITNKESVFTRHFEDSLAAAEYIPQGAKVCDIGSGAGFPGLPLKIVRPDLSLTLFDSVNKKIIFLNEVIRQITNEDNNNLSLKRFPSMEGCPTSPLAECQGRGGLTAVHIRAEDAAAPNAYREKFDVAVCRAVAPLPVLCEYALPLIRTGGLFIAYKTAAAVEPETAAAQNAMKILNGKVKQIVPYTLKEINLALIIIEKTGPTPLKYPRGGNKPRLDPL